MGFPEIFNIYGLELSSPSKNKRLDTLIKLSNIQGVNHDLIQILTKLENVPSTITEYRDKERYLDELLNFMRQNKASLELLDYLLGFSYLLGSLYINFEKFWGPSLRAIYIYVNESSYHNDLIHYLLEHLRHTNDFIYGVLSPDPTIQLSDRPDYLLHRNLIFQVLARFPRFIETNSEIFMNELFRFIDNELMVSPFFENLAYDNLLMNEVQKELSTSGGVPSDNNKTWCVPLIPMKKSKETFLTAVKVIHGFVNMKNIHRCSDFKTIVLELLCCRDTSVQKAAFYCIIVYEIDGLKPYINKILRILDDKSVRSELTTFSLNDDCENIISANHRDDLMPILLRILFGKMRGRIGKKSSGRAKAEQRKSLVMRFVSGCPTNEIIFFFKLLFYPVFDYVEVPFRNLEEFIRAKIDYTKYIPVTKLQAMIATISAYIKSVAHIKEDTLPFIYKLINVIMFHVIEPLNSQNSNINLKCCDSLKVCRRESFNIINQFFLEFQYYRFQQDEIDFPFKILIWPISKEFINQNYCTPTPLLRLIETFSQNAIYHQLLIKRNDSDRDEFLLRYLVDLYTSDKTSPEILKRVAHILRSILSPEVVEDPMDVCMEPTKAFCDANAMIPEIDLQKFNITESIPFNHRILLSFLPQILNKLENCCTLFLETIDSSYQLCHDELLILSSLSCYVKDDHQCLLMVQLLLLAKDATKKNDLIIDSLRTCQKLIQQVKYGNFIKIIELISDSLGFQRNLEQRSELCKLLHLSVKSNDYLKDCTKAVNLMNSTTGDIDSPDLILMNEGFLIIFRLLSEISQDSSDHFDDYRSLLVISIHQVGFILNNLDKYEFSVRENCLIFYEKLSKKLVDMTNMWPDFANFILDEFILGKFVKKGLRNENETIKNTYIAVIKILADECHSINKTLMELYYFCDVNRDLDFWLNLKHIQVHNRSRAIARLVADKRLSNLTPKTLSSYFLPIASGFLFTKKFIPFGSLIDNSIKLIGLISRTMNWKLYESTLNYYLGLLTKANPRYQKQNIKVITVIMKNFNFDITRCPEAMEHEDENSKLQSRMLKRVNANSNKFQDTKEMDSRSIKQLNPSTAKMVYMAVTKKILPKLDGYLHEMTRVELENDKHMSNHLSEKDAIKRIPIAYAIVQLLNLLPCRYVLFRDHLPTIFLKLATFLKSKDESIRKCARDTINKIIAFTGPLYVTDLLRILRQQLDKGFHIHVLYYTVHSTLEKLDPLEYSCLDHCSDDLVDMCMQEIFGRPSEDKEVAQIIAKTPEAKKTKSYDTIMILSSCIGVEKLNQLMVKVKHLLKTSNDPKKVNKLTYCVQRIFSGLSKNHGFPTGQLLDFVKNEIEESIPSLSIRQRIENPAEKITNNIKKPIREDNLLIKKDLPRNRLVSRINERGNLHIVLDNCLRLLLTIFEREKPLLNTDHDLTCRLESFVKLLSICLKATSSKCISRALKCVYFIFKVCPQISSLEKKSNTIVKRIFIILNMYNGVGRGDNFDLIGVSFKTLTTILLKCKYVTLLEDQVRALLTYIEQNLHDNSRQANAFKSLITLLRRKFDTPELKDIMLKVADILVTVDDENLQTLTIKAWSLYLLEVNHQPNVLRSHLMKFLRQLDYEHSDGRKSIIRLVKVVIIKFPEKILLNYFELIFHLLSNRLVNEEDKDLRRQIGKSISILIQRLPNQQNYICNKFILQWATNETTEIKILGVKLVSIYTEATKNIDRDKLSRIITMIQDIITDEKFHSYDEKNSDSNGNINTTNSKLIYHTLRLFKRLVTKELIKVDDLHYSDKLSTIWISIATQLLDHKFLPIVTTSCELSIYFLRSTNLTIQSSCDDMNKNHLAANMKKLVRSMCDKFINLLDRIDEFPKLFDYIIESLCMLGTLVAQSDSSKKFEDLYISAFKNKSVLSYFADSNKLPSQGFERQMLPYSITEARRKLDLFWLSTKIIMQARKEVALYRLKADHRRSLVLKWTAHILQQLGPKRSQSYILLYLMIPIRELSDRGKQKGSSLLGLAEDLLKYIKTIIGVDLFNQIYSKVQIYYTKKRVIRKRDDAIMKVKDQAHGVKRKLKMRRNKPKKKFIKSS